ncbi:MAG: FKBP-type peptidyl-prolyl cis-trans isomerase [Patescibacteria group bacterium]
MERRLSKKEWVALVIAVGFVGYTLFGYDIMNLFKNDTNSMTNENTATVPNSQNNQGVITSDLVVGTGMEVLPGKSISVHYILSLKDGTVIQNSKDFGVPFEFTLGVDPMIKGWEIGIAGMKVGGVRSIIIPPELAYGSVQSGPIPPNSTLVFTVEIVNVADATQ